MCSTQHKSAAELQYFFDICKLFRIFLYVLFIFLHYKHTGRRDFSGTTCPKVRLRHTYEKRGRAQGCAPPQKKREKGLFLFSYGPLGGVGGGKGAKEGIVPEGESGFGIIDAFE